jgi:hypothetical protein
MIEKLKSNKLTGFRRFPDSVSNFSIFLFSILHRVIRILSVAVCFSLPLAGFSQFGEKIVFNGKDIANDYYLAVPPISGNIHGVLVLISSFSSPEYILTETKLPNTASGNELLTIMASMGTGLWADSISVERINHILTDVIGRFSADTAKFAIGGLGYAGDIALRYTEMCYEKPMKFPVLPKAVFAINCPVDLTGLAQWCESEIKKNYYAGDVGDAKYILETLKNKLGVYAEHPEKYIEASPFYKYAGAPGNERFLDHLAVRLYYDTDITWQLKTRRNSYYDTFIPDGSELVKQLLLSGNSEAEFVSSKLPGIRTSGQRSPFSWSLVDEVDCIQWIKLGLKIFNPQNYIPVYQLPVPEGWSTERFSLPPDFAREIKATGVEDLRFFPEWGNANSEEHWSYAYLWWLEGKTEIDAPFLQDNLKTLYTGLVDRNIVPRKIPVEKVFPVVVKLNNVKTEPGDIKTFKGTVNMLDYIIQSPMILNVIVHQRNCADKNHNYLLFEVSPKPFNHPNWEKLNRLNTDFSCNQ